MKKYCSFGGAGDAFIVACKLAPRDGLEEGPAEWMHVESFDIGKMFDDICSITDIGGTNLVHASFKVDPDYISNLKQGRYNDYEYISTSVDGWSEDLQKQTMKLENPFEATEYYQAYPEKKAYDVCIQVASGANTNNRRWRYNPLTLAHLLRTRGYKVCLVGNAEIYADKNDEDNFVNKLSLHETLKKVALSKILLSTAGLLTYFGLSVKIPTVYMQESLAHNKRYIHPFCEKYAYPVEFGSIQEVKKELERFGVKI